MAKSERGDLMEFQKDVDAMARTAWAEARGEGVIGMFAVMCVIMNRVHDTRWPDTAHGVCFQNWQFSCWNPYDANGDKARTITENDALFDCAMAMARTLMQGQAGDDPTDGANHYYAAYIKPPTWIENMEHKVTLGTHKFFKG